MDRILITDNRKWVFRVVFLPPFLWFFRYSSHLLFDGTCTNVSQISQFQTNAFMARILQRFQASDRNQGCVFKCHPAPKSGKQMVILKLWLLGCACICSSKILKPLGGKINLEGNNGIPGSLFFRPPQNVLFRSISALQSDFNPQNIDYIPPVKILMCLDLERN